MKHFKKIISLSAAALMWAAPLLLIVPNIALDFTEITYSPLARAVNVLLPFGIYLLLTSWARNVGRTVVLMIPVMVLCAFQIVLLFLYGESIIAIDMFLNVMTTNVHEATELLGNLLVALVCVLILYVPLIIAAVTMWIRADHTSHLQRRVARISGAVAAILGLVAMCLAMGRGTGYRIDRQLFPANVVANLIESIRRTALTTQYYKTSQDFDYHARATHPDSIPEIYVMVIGETSRADNWQLAGYPRPTTPRLAARDRMVFYPKALSESNTTHKSVPLMLTPLDADRFGDSIYCTRSILDAFNQAGYATAWLSNQSRNHSFIDYFAAQAQNVRYLGDDLRKHTDLDLVDSLRDYLSQNPARKTFIVLHTYGSHFNYRDRYTDSAAYFTPDHAAEADVENRPHLLNAYDNTIRQTDLMLDSIMTILEDTGRPAAMVYLSDHGEDIFDDTRERFLHASPTPTYWQIHVPMVVWASGAYDALYPTAVATAASNAHANVSSSQSAFHTLLDLAGVDTPYLHRAHSLISRDFREPQRRYLNDYNEGVMLQDASLRPNDFLQLQKAGISTD